MADTVTKYQSVLLTNHADDVDALIADRTKFNNLKRHVERYIDSHAEQLNYIAPTKRLIFAREGNDGLLFLNSLGIKPREMTKEINTIKSVAKISAVLKEPVYVTLTLIIRQLLVAKRDREAELFLMYLSLALYSSLQYRTFQYEPNENVVSYTMSRISNKFYFKQYGTVYKAIYQIASGLAKNNNSTLQRDSDKDIIEYIMFLRSRISNSMVKFARELYKDINEGNYINTVKDSRDEEDYYEVENLSGTIDNLTSRVTLSFSQQTVDKVVVRMAAQVAEVNSQFLGSVIYEVKTKEMEKATRVIRNMLITYLKESNPVASVGSRKFINESLKIYSKSNTTDRLVLEIKEIMDYFLTNYSEKYTATEREATKIKYRKSVFVFFVLFAAKVL